MPNLSFADKVLIKKYRINLCRLKNIIDLENEGINPNVVNLLKLGWLSSIEELSNYRKAGNGLKKKVKESNRTK